MTEKRSVTMTEVKYEQELTRSYEVGKSAGWQDAGELLMEEAATAFRRGKDEEARRLRELGQQLQAHGKGLHPGSR